MLCRPIRAATPAAATTVTATATTKWQVNTNVHLRLCHRSIEAGKWTPSFSLAITFAITLSCILLSKKLISALALDISALV